jgi:hypothetical protein
LVIVGKPCDVKKRLGPRLYLPPPTPRAGFTAKHPSKDAARPQLRNFAVLIKDEVLRIHLPRTRVNKGMK